MSYSNILLEEVNGIGTIKINRPKKLNALNVETIRELHEAFKYCNDKKSITVIILIGEGEKAFVAGADISEFAHYDVEKGTQLSAKGQKLLFDYVEQLSTPVICCINGFALGGGLELAMSCHIRLASTNAKMGLPETSLGVIPGYGGTQRLTQLVGKGRALEMILTAGMIDSNQALTYGLVNHVTTLEELQPLAEKIASKIQNNSPSAIASAIRAVNAGQDKSLNGYEVEISEFGKCFGTEDFKEGTTAFLEKRKAKFNGN
ncbi:enoyl-CoA hydratase/isomerase family protein [Aegicerativicinus sediminis]|uniref:enoyl-CoA hydratase/isomerase family protein n=1 Tax=Aegicerativicinus sediminis TaxID=2893202 RepID=UPI001E4A77B7|nr:enoyl-CoA hydratase-related protein [Aegicerativicinus sediminis]